MIHADLLKRLLPPTSLDPSGVALSGELVAEGRALDLAQWWADQILQEMSPPTTAALLSDWERVYGLPEACISQAGISQSVSERRAALLAKRALLGGNRRPFSSAWPPRSATRSRSPNGGLTRPKWIPNMASPMSRGSSSGRSMRPSIRYATSRPKTTRKWPWRCGATR